MISEDSSFNPVAKAPISIIHDGDHGGDDLVTSLMALARPNHFNLLGITTCFGNIPVSVATKNACLAIDLMPRAGVYVHEGSSRPWKSPSRAGDNAFGSNGLGGVEMPEPLTTPSSTPALEWLTELLGNSEEALTLCLTGPFTNVAKLLELRPDLRNKIHSIIAMGGCLTPQEPHGRQGNITPFAEFNLYMDAEAANSLLQCGVPLVLFPLDVTHQLVFTKARQDMAREVLSSGLGEKIIRIINAAHDLDSSNFNLEGGVFHDECVVLYLLRPDLFQGRRMSLQVNTDADCERYGQLTEAADASESNVLLIDTLVDSDKAFELILEDMKKIEK